ncbi:MAG: KGK domain-containing protein [Xenococcaceae cyanobacterium]
MEDNFYTLQEDDVVSVNPPLFESGKTAKIEQIIEEYRLNFVRQINANKASILSKTGISCEVLRADGNGWKTGKIKFILVFEPDEPEDTTPRSPLDDIRKNQLTN